MAKEGEIERSDIIQAIVWDYLVTLNPFLVECSFDDKQLWWIYWIKEGDVDYEAAVWSDIKSLFDNVNMEMDYSEAVLSNCGAILRDRQLTGRTITLSLFNETSIQNKETATSGQ